MRLFDMRHIAYLYIFVGYISHELHVNANKIIQILFFIKPIYLKAFGRLLNSALVARQGDVARLVYYQSEIIVVRVFARDYLVVVGDSRTADVTYT